MSRFTQLVLISVLVLGFGRESSADFTEGPIATVEFLPIANLDVTCIIPMKAGVTPDEILIRRNNREGQLSLSSLNRRLKRKLEKAKRAENREKTKRIRRLRRALKKCIEFSKTITDDNGSSSSLSSSGSSSSRSSGSSSSSTPAICGNGIVEAAEECDDGNTNYNDSCDSLCQGNHYRVFVSSVTYTGNLGGLSGADVKCQQLADAAGFPASWSWKAWLSDDTTSAAQRLFHSNVPYRRVDGIKVADNWGDLTDGVIQNSISVNEWNIRSVGTVWSYTRADGSNNVLYRNCYGWTYDGAFTNQNNNTYGHVGDSNAVTAGWTYISGAHACMIVTRIYCVQQP